MRCSICDYCETTKEGLLTEYSDHNKVNRESGLCDDCNIFTSTLYTKEDSEVLEIFNDEITITGEVPNIEREFDNNEDTPLPKRDVFFE